MKRSVRKAGTNTIQLVLVFVGFVLLAYYATVTLTTRDPLWFLGRFQGQPSRIVVYHAGQRTELQPGQPGFDELASAVQTSLGEGFAHLSSIGFSEGTLQDAYTLYVTLEVFFAQPVELHTWFPTGRTTQMLFPITGRHSEQPLVLLGEDGNYRAGAPVLNTAEPIHQALQSLGYYEP
jgi:hypothetical protein